MADVRRKPYPDPTSPRMTYGVPTWVGMAVVLGGLVLAFVSSLAAGAVGVQHMVLFGVTSLGAAFITEARGLWITVASIPLAFAVFTAAAGWAASVSSSQAGLFSATTIIASAYPLAENFPTLALVTAAAAGVTAVRLLLIRNAIREDNQRRYDRRMAYAQAEQRQQHTVERLRHMRRETPTHRPSRITVAELRDREGRRRRP